MAWPSSNVFSLTYDAAQHLLVGHWLRDTSDDDLYPSYERLLAEAQAHDRCRFWLLDMRGRSWHSENFGQWLADLLARRVVHELGSPVFIAYVAAEHHRAAIESAATEAILRQAAQVEFYPYFFDSEEAAREWLVYYQRHPGRPPAQRQGG